MTRWATTAEAEARRAATLEAMRQGEAERITAAAAVRAEGRAARLIVGACWVCGSRDDLDGPTSMQLPLPLGRIEGATCKFCRQTRGLMPELVTRRLWTTGLPERWGWVPVPSRQTEQAVRGGYAIDRDGVPLTEVAWTVADPWPPYTWAFRVIEARRAGRADSTPPRKPFGWLR